MLARDRILPTIRALMASMTRAEVMAKLDGTGMPFAPIGKPEELFDDPHLATGGLEPVTLDDGRQTRLPTIPLEMAGGRPGQPQTLASPGEQSREVLAGLGYDADRIAALIASGAVEES